MRLLSSYFYRLYRETNELNKSNVLNLLSWRPEGRLLDCGCGDGELTVRLGDRAGVAELHGIEAWRLDYNHVRPHRWLGDEPLSAFAKGTGLQPTASTSAPLPPPTQKTATNRR